MDAYIGRADLTPRFTSEERVRSKLAQTAEITIGLGGLYLLAALVS